VFVLSPNGLFLALASKKNDRAAQGSLIGFEMKVCNTIISLCIPFLPSLWLWTLKDNPICGAVPLGILNLTVGPPWGEVQRVVPSGNRVAQFWSTSHEHLFSFILERTVGISSLKRSTAGSVGQVEKDTSGDMGDGVLMLIRVY